MAYSTSARDSSSVVAAGVAGDVTRMWAEFAARLRAFVARRVPAGIEPDDVVQEVFLRVVRRLPSLRDADRIEAWLFQIASHAPSVLRGRRGSASRCVGLPPSRVCRVRQSERRVRLRTRLRARGLSAASIASAASGAGPQRLLKWSGEE